MILRSTQSICGASFSAARNPISGLRASLALIRDCPSVASLKFYGWQTCAGKGLFFSAKSKEEGGVGWHLLSLRCWSPGGSTTVHLPAWLFSFILWHLLLLLSKMIRPNCNAFLQERGDLIVYESLINKEEIQSSKCYEIARDNYILGGTLDSKDPLRARIYVIL